MNEKEVVSDTSVDKVMTLALRAIFAPRISEQERKAASLYFTPETMFILVPRRRPTLATSMRSERFFDHGRSLIASAANWRERWRTVEGAADRGPGARVVGVVDLDSGAIGRAVDMVCVARNRGNWPIVTSCCLVYDEHWLATSAITHNMRAINDEMIELAQRAHNGLASRD